MLRSKTTSLSRRSSRPKRIHEDYKDDRSIAMFLDLLNYKNSVSFVSNFFDKFEIDQNSWEKNLHTIVDDMQKIGIDLYPIDLSVDMSLQREVRKLYSQLGKYQCENSAIKTINPFDMRYIISKLNAGNEKFSLTKSQLAKNVTDPSLSSFNSTDPFLFRKMLIRSITVQLYNKSIPKYGGDIDVRKKNVFDATISLKSLVGVETKILYNLALQEEIYSSEFREACFINSIDSVSDVSWKVGYRPAMIIGGPSASGKTYATKAAVRKFADLCGTYSLNSKALYSAIDGGIIRSTSQVRKYLIQIAIRQGFTGINDLHNNSKSLGQLKIDLFDAIKDVSNIGIVLPDTFSDFITPLSPMPYLVKNLCSLKHAQLVSVQVYASRTESSNTKFKQAVEFQGYMRAWKVYDDSPQSTNIEIDLNILGSKLPESKVYNPRSFELAVVGSDKFRDKCKSKYICIDVINDRQVVKYDYITNDYVPAKLGEINAQLCSYFILSNWRLSSKSQTLDEYSKSYQSTAIVNVNVPRDFDSLQS